MACKGSLNYIELFVPREGAAGQVLAITTNSTRDF